MRRTRHPKRRKHPPKSTQRLHPRTITARAAAVRMTSVVGSDPLAGALLRAAAAADGREAKAVGPAAAALALCAADPAPWSAGAWSDRGATRSGTNVIRNGRGNARSVTRNGKDLTVSVARIRGTGDGRKNAGGTVLHQGIVRENGLVPRLLPNPSVILQWPMQIMKLSLSRLLRSLSGSGRRSMYSLLVREELTSRRLNSG